MSNNKQTKRQEIGSLGEDIAMKYLQKRKFDIIDRNYWKKWGEIDIVAKKGGLIHFVEVKSVTRENIDNVIHETDDSTSRPEDNLHPWKLKRLSRAIQSYLLEKNPESDWQFDVIIVYINTEDKRAKLRFLENIIL